MDSVVLRSTFSNSSFHNKKLAFSTSLVIFKTTLCGLGHSISLYSIYTSTQYNIQSHCNTVYIYNLLHKAILVEKLLKSNRKLVKF